ncbi:hypothetical protein BH18ACT4_BH18ACT4_10790 [soil metagenome]
MVPVPYDEAARRRTFAIISHPDAGKTTLTEKFLLYGGALAQAGAVKARRGGRSATSDWMDLERQRGISITSTVLQFPYRGHVLNHLDTPWHRDRIAFVRVCSGRFERGVVVTHGPSGRPFATK